MRIVIAPDSFKECLSAREVCTAIQAGILRADPDAEVTAIPMADGGEGTVDAMVSYLSGTIHEAEIFDPLGRAVGASYGVIDDGETAIIEMAAASGLQLVDEEDRDPARASTYGTGQLMADALARGCTRIMVGLGGSATNDGGAGMARALGYAFKDSSGLDLGPGGAALAHLHHIDGTEKNAALDSADVVALYDVSIPLCGPRGTSKVYGPQKGAGDTLAAELDRALLHFADIISLQLGPDVAKLPGAGAAGGLGAGLVAFAGARLLPGFETVAETCGLSQAIAGADLVITGEGRLDLQSLDGKTPVGVARIAKEHGLPVVAFAGSLGPNSERFVEAGIDKVLALHAGPVSEKEALERAAELLADMAEDLIKRWLAGERVAPAPD